jgi:hypothetical protein
MPPISHDEYQKALSDVDAALAPGFADIGKAQTPADLEGALSAVAIDLGIQADHLEKLSPPLAVVTENRDLVSGMRRLSDDASAVATDAGNSKVCTGASGRPRAASGNGAHVFRLAVLGVANAEPGHPYAFGGFLPASSPDQNRRPANGDLPGGRRGGLGRLTVEADGDLDHVVKIMQGGALIRAVFVGAGGNATVTGIPNGAYEVYSAGGHDWDDVNRRFTRDCQFKKVNDTVVYTTRDLSRSVQYTTWTLTLHAARRGNTPTSPIAPSDFPTA